MIEVLWECGTCGQVLLFTIDETSAQDPVRRYNEAVRAVNEHMLSHDNGHTP